MHSKKCKIMPVHLQPLKYFVDKAPPFKGMIKKKIQHLASHYSCTFFRL